MKIKNHAAGPFNFLISFFTTRLHKVAPIHYSILWMLIFPWNELLIVSGFGPIQRRDGTSSLFWWTAKCFFFTPSPISLETIIIFIRKCANELWFLPGPVFFCALLFLVQMIKKNITCIFHQAHQDFEKNAFRSFWLEKLNNTQEKCWSITLSPHYDRREAVTLQLTHIGS